MTFYRFPTKSLISSWDGKTPSNFKFSFKVPRIITHYKRLTRAEPYFERFLESLELLRKKKKLATPMITSDTHAFIRWHGRKAWYNYNYSKKELETWAKELSRIMDKVPMVYGYFNNDVRAYAPFNAFDLLEMLDEGADIRQKLEIATKRAAAAA
jgi:uncharacterized protein YecE (DUF72 family)